MADYDITLPDVELPDFEGLQSQIEQVEVLSDMKSFIEKETSNFKSENLQPNQVSFELPKNLILQYQDRATFESCNLLTQDINKKIVQIQVKYLSVKKSILQQINEMMSYIDGYYLEPSYNVEVISDIPKNFEFKKLKMVEEIPLPECLKEYEVSNKTDISVDVMIQIEAEKCAKLLIPSCQFSLFKICQNIEEILNVGIFEDIQKLKEQLNCVKECCEPHFPYVVKVLDKIVLPYDKFDGNFRVYRLGLYKKEFAFFNTQKGLDFLNRLDFEYQQFSESIDNCVSEIKYEFSKQSKETYFSYKL